MSTLTVQPHSPAGPAFIDASDALDDMAPRFAGAATSLSFNGVDRVESQVERNRNDELLAMVAHELRGPLNALKLSTEMIRRVSSGRREIERSLEAIDRQIAHLTQLADDLLDATRVAHGVFHLHKVRTDFDTVLTDSLEGVGLAAEKRGQTFSIETPVEKIWTNSDPIRLAQAISNMLVNAVKYTSISGSIKLTVRAERNDLVVSVKDNGQGISSSLLPHVFDLFTQSRRTIASSADGLGIGLAIVKAIAELHGGTISASSGGPGAGSEFVLRLPIIAARENVSISE
ncbi:sensor histidine kinase [Caballeronia sp. 15715]|jgi:signal transduction histidine kinase|uniref:sensor histidine kinase n=1 Tax=unclassified Caballeronia TaxID=2646786 RepID=UPI0039E35657